MLCKCLVVKNPWALMLVDGIKDVENRTWNTSYRGPLLIKSSKVPVSEDETRDILTTLYRRGLITKDQVRKYYQSIFSLNGRLLGQVTLDKVVTNSNSEWAEKGAYHFVVSSPKKFSEPIEGLPSGFKIFNLEVNESILL